MRVTVLLGGPSAEREVSLVSGRAVAGGLKAAGHQVFSSDISPDDLSALDHPCDVVFPVLHGAWGESGELQEILEQRALPFVGSSSRSARIGMNKIQAKKAWQRARLPTPPYVVVSKSAIDNPQSAIASLGLPCVVKAHDSGSSIDVYICKSSAEAHSAIERILDRHEQVLVEKFIHGPELTVGLLEEQPLEAIRIVVHREFFDFDAKYKACGTEHRFDTGLPAALVQQCQELARKANSVLGCRDLARVDIMVDEEGEPRLLEINTMPGFTPTSLLPEAAAHAGISFEALVDRLVKRAAARGAISPPLRARRGRLRGAAA